MRRRGRLKLVGAAVAALLAVNAALLVIQPGLALPNALRLNYFLGPNMIRAEVVLQDPSGLHDYRFDQGRIQVVRRNSLQLFERDGTVVIVPVSPGAEVLLNGQPAVLGQLRRGMRAMTIRDGERPAHLVRAVGRR